MDEKRPAHWGDPGKMEYHNVLDAPVEMSDKAVIRIWGKHGTKIEITRKDNGVIEIMKVGGLDPGYLSAPKSPTS